MNFFKNEHIFFYSINYNLYPLIKKKISILSHMEKKLQARQYLQNCSHGYVKKHAFLRNFRSKILTISSINRTFFYLETQN